MVFFSSRRRHTIYWRDWSSDVCSSDLTLLASMDLTAQLTAASRVIDRWLPYKMFRGRLPGLSVGIVYQKTLLFQNGYGYADVEQQQPTSKTTGYRIPSFSKIFTAISILQPPEEGKLHLD